MSGLCAWCGQFVIGSQVRPGVIVSATGLQEFGRAHWIGRSIRGDSSRETVADGATPSDAEASVVAPMVA
jgi:hypothetical protein